MVEKKGYKQTEVGVIPEEWVPFTIGSLIQFQGGSQPPRSTFVFFEKEGYIRLLQIRDYKTDKYATFVPKHLANRFCDKEDIMIGRYGPPIFQILKGMEGAYNVALIKAIPQAKLLKSYAYHFLKQDKLFFFVEKLSQRSSGQTGVDLKELRAYPFPLPPTKAEQTAIATALSDADALIQSLEKLIAKKRLIKQGAMQELLKPKEGWVVKKLGEVANTIASGKSNTKSNIGNYPIYGSTGIIGWNKSFDYEGHSILVARVGANAGTINIVDGKYNVSDNTLMVSFSRNVDIVFLFYKLNGCQLNTLVFGSGQPLITGSQLKSLEMAIPATTVEQTRIATILYDMDAEISTMETKLDKYKQVKQGMGQNLLTGKIRLVENATAKQKVIAIDKKPSRKNHNWQINEAVVIAVLTKEFGSDEFPLGRKRYTKLSYLLHRYVERETKGYLKKVAGPYNPSTRYGGPERIAQENKYIKQSSLGQYSGFVPSDNIAQAEEYFHKWYGQNALKWLNQFKYEKNDTLELWGTVDMAVQDLKRTGKEVSTEAVKSLINNTEEWKPKLKRPIFSDENIAMAILKTEELFDG